MSQAYFWPPSGGGTSTNASVGINGSTAPASSTEVGFINGGGNLTGVSPTNPLPVTPGTGAVFSENLTQVGGNSVTTGAGASAAGTQRVILSSDSPLATGASTSALQTTGNTSLSSIDSKTPALGQQLAAASQPVVLTAAQLTTLTPLTTVTVTQATGTNLHTVVDSGTITANAGTNLNTSALALETGGNLASINTKTPALGQALAAASVPIVLTAAQLTTLTPLSTVTANQGTANGTPWNENVAQINGVTPLMGNGVTGTGSLRVTLASDTTSNTNPLLIASNTATTGTITTVASSATSVTILASNTARKGMTVYNDSTAILYLALTSTAASTTAYTVQMAANSYFELPFVQRYTGTITGIWASATGNARVTEMT